MNSKRLIWQIKRIWRRIVQAPVFHKKPLYLVLTIVLSILLLADVAMAVLVPDTGSMGNMQDMQSMQMPDSFDSDSTGGTDDADTDDSDNDTDDADADNFGNSTDETDAESDSSDKTEESSSDSTEDAASDNDDTSNENTDSDSSTDMSAGGSGDAMPSGGRGDRSSDFSSEDGEMPDMGDGEMSSSENGEMPDMEDGGMPDMGDGSAPSFGNENSDGSTDSAESSDSEETDSADSESGRSFGNGDFADTQNSGFSALRILQSVRSHWLLILIILAILDAGSIFMLIRISRREKKQKQAEEKALREQAAAGEIVRRVQPAKKESKHSHYLWIIALVLIVLLVVLVKIFTRQTTSSGTETEATTYTETAATGNIDTVLPGTGTLEEEESEDLSLPNEVEITEWYVSDGDTVEEGDTLAAVDQVSVMTAIATVQENLASLDEALADCEDDAVSETITAAADGRVIKIYASADTTAVVDTMYENSALMLLSLDGYMAVSIETDAEISTGDSVDVTLSDGTTVTGKVESLTNTTAIIVISDDGSELGDTVTVETEDGTTIGEGTLYIHSELKVTGYTGTVSSVSVSEGDEVNSGDTLLTLTDTDYSAEYETLLEQRAELETQMETLFKLYEDGYIYASCSGVVSGLDSSSSSDTSTSTTESSADDGTTESTSSSDDSDSSGSSSGSETSGDSDSSSSDSASETSASGSSGYTVSNLSYTGSSSTYLTIRSDQGTSATLTSGTNNGSTATGSSSTAAGNSSVVSSASSSGNTDTSGSGSAADDSSDMNDTADDRSSDDSTSTDTESTTVQIGVVQSVSENTVTLLLLSGETMTVSLSDLNSVGIYQNGSYNSNGSVSDIAEGDILILTCIGDTVSSATCISTSGTASDADVFTGDTGSQESGSDLTGSQSDTSEQANGSAQTDGTGQEGSSSGENSLTGQVSDESETAMTADTSAMTESADTATEAETAASEALTEEVESTYGVDETTLLAITPQDTMTLEITVDEMDILSVEVGQEATITLDAFPGQSFTGTVTSINESGSNSGGSSKYTAVITMDREDDMLAGMNASAKITLSTTEDVLIIPETALVEENGTTYVYTTYDEETDTLGGLTEVTTGTSDGTNVEITSGLEEGDTYCYSVLDVVNYSSSYSSSGSGGSFSIESLFGSGGGRGGF